MSRERACGFCPDENGREGSSSGESDASGGPPDGDVGREHEDDGHGADDDRLDGDGEPVDDTRDNTTASPTPCDEDHARRRHDGRLRILPPEVLESYAVRRWRRQASKPVVWESLAYCFDGDGPMTSSDVFARRRPARLGGRICVARVVEPDEDAALEHDEISARSIESVRCASERLTDRQRVVLFLSCVHGEQLRSIARTLRVSLSAVQGLGTRGKRRLTRDVIPQLRRLGLRLGWEDTEMPSSLDQHVLEDGSRFYTGRLPEWLRLSDARFLELWSLHPKEYQTIAMQGHRVPTPRWQQAFGVDDRNTECTNKALPVPEMIRPHLEWAVSAIDPRLNGILVNFYDGKLGHYIGRHRDSRTNMVEGSPIVTISFGAERCLRLRPWKGHGFLDFKVTDGGVFVMPYETNRVHPA